MDERHGCYAEEEDCNQEEDKYSLEHDECDEDSIMSNKVFDEDSWTFMEDPIYDMTEEYSEYNEPESFEGLIDNLIHVMSKKGSIESLDGFIEYPIYEVFREDSMGLEVLENICMEEEHAVCPYDQSKPSISSSNEDMEKLCSEE